ncbi:hypothetical protein PWT90_10693 [Aphanocladium album]|nr:hypothetical protein PWT90_10693 [Aphanocladium album]
MAPSHYIGHHPAPELRAPAYSQSSLGQMIVSDRAARREMDPDSETLALNVEQELLTVSSLSDHAIVPDFCAHIREFAIKLSRLDSVGDSLHDWSMITDVIGSMPQLEKLSITGRSAYLGGNLGHILEDAPTWTLRDATFCVSREDSTALVAHCEPTTLHRLRVSCDGRKLDSIRPRQVGFGVTHLELWIPDQGVEEEASCPDFTTLAIVHCDAESWEQIQGTENEESSVAGEDLVDTMLRRHNNSCTRYFAAVLDGLAGLTRLALTVPRELALWFAYRCPACGLGHHQLRVHTASSAGSDTSETVVEDSDGDESDAETGSRSAASTDTAEVDTDELCQIDWKAAYQHLADHAYMTSGETLVEVVFLTGIGGQPSWRFVYPPGDASSGAGVEPVARLACGSAQKLAQGNIARARRPFKPSACLMRIMRDGARGAAIEPVGYTTLKFTRGRGCVGRHYA